MIAFILFGAFRRFNQENYCIFSMSKMFYQFFSDSYRFIPIAIKFYSSFSFLSLPLQQRTQT